MADQQSLPATTDAECADPHVFSFGDPESVLDRSELLQYFEIWHNGRWYEPPLPVAQIAKAFNMSAHHRSAIALKVNLLVSHQLPSRWLDADAFERFAIDFLQMGNGYLEDVPNLGGRIARASHAPALHMRKGTKEDQYWFVNGPMGKAHEFGRGRIFHLQQPDVAQELYGMPEWLSALQSGLLNENATLFRRRYFLNGAHAGALFYISEPLADADTVRALENALRESKGVGNFKNLLINIPNGKKDGVQIMPIGEVMAKDDFAAIKNISRDDLLAAHRVPPQLLGIIPQNTGGFGNVGEAKDAFYEAEIVPLMGRMLRMNAWAPGAVRLLAFRDYVCSDGSRITETGERIAAGQLR